MVFKFYKTEKVVLPDGDEFEVVPITVEDMPLVLDIIEIQKKIAEAQNQGEVANNMELMEMNVKEFFPLAWKIAQRGVKRTMSEYDEMNIEELDEVRDEPMSMNVAVLIATKMIEVSMTDMGADTKKAQVVSRKARKKPSKKSKSE